MSIASGASIDIHAHAIVPELDAIVRGQDGFRRELELMASSASADSARQNRDLMRTVYAPRFANVSERIAAMDAMGIDIQAVSPAPTQYHYWADLALAERIAETVNPAIAALCASRPDRLLGLGTVPLQHPELAAATLRRALETHALRGVIVNTNVNSIDLADVRFEPFWSAAETLGALVFIHPMGCALDGRLVPYYFSNVIGNPAETTVALAHIVFSGLLDRHPRVKICAAHGGGYFPFYIGRFDHGWRVRPEAHTCAHAPSEYLARLSFDSLVYNARQLEYLIRAAGARQIVLGTDFPFDMGVDDPIARLDAVRGLPREDRAAIVGLNAARLLGLPRAARVSS
jgi:aminocarboxymuconate-semialdehyde decarboxylase